MAMIAPDAMFVESGRRETRQQYEENHLPADIDFEKDNTGTRGPWSFRINGDTGNNYNTQYTQSAATAVSGAAQTAAAFANVGLQPVAAALAGTFAIGNLHFAGLDAPSGHTSILPWTFDNTIQSPATGQWVQQGGGTWNGAAPYTTITIFPEAGNWIAGSQFSLEGWDAGLP